MVGKGPILGRLRFDRSRPRRSTKWASESEGLSGEAVKGNPTTVILRLDKSK